jgi:hypothetical protein
MRDVTVKRLCWSTGLAAAGAALVCWGLALGGYWPVAFALYGPRVLPAAGATLALGVALAGAGGGLLAGGLVAALAGARPDGVAGSERRAD